MMIFLLTAASLLFITHVILIFTSFGKKGYRPFKYLWSHATLWLAGILLSIVLWQYAGSGTYPAADAFNTPAKKVIPIIAALGLSIIAHAVVKMLVIPHYNGDSKEGR